MGRFDSHPIVHFESARGPNELNCGVSEILDDYETHPMLQEIILPKHPEITVKSFLPSLVCGTCTVRDADLAKIHGELLDSGIMMFQE